MAPKNGPLSWAEEAAILSKVSKANSDGTERPAWMVTEEELEDYFALLRPARILMTGSRGWEDTRSISGAIRRALKFLKKEADGSTLVHGAARGADTLAAEIAEELGLETEAHPANWKIHNDNCPKEEPSNGGCWQGRYSCSRAGFRRNQEMIDSGVDILLAFIKDESSGATGTLNSWLKEDRPTILCRQTGDGPVSGEFLNMDSWKS